MTGPHIDHIGIIVEDMDRAVAVFERLWGVHLVTLKELREVGLKVAQIKTENVRIELIQYTTKEEGFAQKVMGPRPGINHISILVDDVDRSSKKFEETGAKLMDGFPRQGSHGRVAFFQPESTEGILLEISEHP